MHLDVHALRLEDQSAQKDLCSLWVKKVMCGTSAWLLNKAVLSVMSSGMLPAQRDSCDDLRFAWRASACPFFE